MPSKIIKAATMLDLEGKINAAELDSYLPSGGPFLNPEGRMWCQLVTNHGHVTIRTAGEIQLREPAPVKTKRG